MSIAPSARPRQQPVSASGEHDAAFRRGKDDQSPLEGSAESDASPSMPPRSPLPSPEQLRRRAQEALDERARLATEVRRPRSTLRTVRSATPARRASSSWVRQAAMRTVYRSVTGSRRRRRAAPLNRSDIDGARPWQQGQENGRALDLHWYGERSSALDREGGVSGTRTNQFRAHFPHSSLYHIRTSDHMVDRQVAGISGLRRANVLKQPSWSVPVTTTRDGMDAAASYHREDRKERTA
jgi:hypothetical protein